VVEVPLDLLEVPGMPWIHLAGKSFSYANEFLIRRGTGLGLVRPLCPESICWFLVLICSQARKAFVESRAEMG
jgi:hypothetical protein